MLYKNILFYLSLFLLLSGCGVETSSSVDRVATTPIVSDTNDDSNDSDIVPSDTNSTEDNVTTTPVDTPQETIESIFSTIDAKLDADACTTSNGNNLVSDNSLDPEPFVDEGNGIAITSSFPIVFDPDKSEVKLFYPSLLESKTTAFVNILGDKFLVSFDKAWIGNIRNTVYVQTPKNIDDRFGCYRMTLSSESKADITIEKVYR
jgi:hypothetical protein